MSHEHSKTKSRTKQGSPASFHDCVTVHRESLGLHKLLHEEPVPGVEGLHKGFLKEQGNSLRRLHICDGMLVHISTHTPQVLLQYLQNCPTDYSSKE